MSVFMPPILPNIYDWEKEKQTNQEANTHSHKHTHRNTDQFPRYEFLAGLECGEEGVKGNLLIAYVQILLHISTSFKDLHASLTIVKNILNWL